MTPPPTTPTRATRTPSTPDDDEGGDVLARASVRSGRSATNAVTTTSPSSPSSRATSERHRRPSFVSRPRPCSRSASRSRGQPTRPALVDQPGRLGALADRRLADPEPAARLDVGQPLVQRVDDLPAAVGAPFEDAGPQPEHGLQLLGTVVLATDSDPVRHGLRPGDGVAGVQVRRAATGAGVRGQRLLDRRRPRRRPTSRRPAAGPPSARDRGLGVGRAPPAPRRRRCAGRAARRPGGVGEPVEQRPAPRRRAGGCPAGPP